MSKMTILFTKCSTVVTSLLNLDVSALQTQILHNVENRYGNYAIHKVKCRSSASHHID